MLWVELNLVLQDVKLREDKSCDWLFNDVISNDRWLGINEFVCDWQRI